MYIDLLKYLKITIISISNKVLFNVCLNLKPILFVSLHFFSSMEDKYILQRGVPCLLIKAVRIFRLCCVRFS
jgi:hypothetical protein